MVQKRYLSLDNIGAYRKAFEFSNAIWDSAKSWDYFAKDTIGKQFVKAADSIPANIAEGFGRYTKKEKILFYRYSYGSIQESIDWNRKAHRRQLISDTQFMLNQKMLNELLIEVHKLIEFTHQKLKI